MTRIPDVVCLAQIPPHLTIKHRRYLLSTDTNVTPVSTPTESRAHQSAGQLTHVVFDQRKLVSKEHFKD